MDLIKKIVSVPYTDDQQKEYEIIDCLSKDDHVITLMLKILERERQHKAEILEEMNRLLSLSKICLDDSKYIPGTEIKRKILEFYDKNKNNSGIALVY